MISVNTNLTASFISNRIRLNSLEFNEKTERLSSGLRINSAVDDPSGLAISSGMTAQLRGIDTAIGNAEDTSYMLQLADDYLSGIWDTFERMRELCVRMASASAILAQDSSGAATDPANPGQCKTLQEEIELLKDQIYTSVADTDKAGGIYVSGSASSKSTSARMNYLQKALFSNGYTTPNFETGLNAQVGADNDASNRILITIDNLMTYFSDFATPYNPPDPKGNATVEWYTSYAQQMLDTVDDKMGKVSNLRVQIGTEINRISSTIDDLNTEYINISASNSQIEDADMAIEMTALTKNMIKQQSTDMIFSQANAEPLMISDLIGAIYDGLAPRLASATQA